MSALLYQPVFLAIVSLLCIATAYRYITSSGNQLQDEVSTPLIPLAISILLVFWIGMRPISGVAFGDTANYAMEYANKRVGIVSMDWHSEWIWQWLMMACKGAGLSVHVFFTIVEAGYILSAFWAVKRFMPSNPMLGMLFVWASLMFFTFGTNGLRNGLACHLILLAISFLYDSKYTVGIILCLVAFGIHRSVMLPITMSLVSLFLIRSPQWVIYFWIASIGVSLVAGNAVTSFFSSLGFDDRMSSYAMRGDMSQFSRIGFRWDFLLYSAMPIWMAWYVCVKRQIRENWYNALCVTYCLCNAFWVMVIRSSFSNRFAYLSWFLYPIIVAYPLVNLPVWAEQNRNSGIILLVYCGFTLFMQIIFW